MKALVSDELALAVVGLSELRTLLEEGRRCARDPRERGAQVVRHGAQQGAAHLLRAALQRRGAGLLCEAQPLQRRAGLSGERFGQLALRGIEHAEIFALLDEDAPEDTLGRRGRPERQGEHDAARKRVVPRPAARPFFITQLTTPCSVLSSAPCPRPRR